MRRRAFLTIALGVAAGLNAVHVDFAAAADTTAARGRAGADAGASPITFRRGSDGRILIPVHVNGSGPFDFVLDTAASRSAIATSVAKKLKLTARAEYDSVLNGTNDRTVVQVVRINSVEAGAFRLTEAMLALLPENEIGAQGVLGTDALAGHIVDLDFDAARISAPDIAPRVARTLPITKRFGELLLIDAVVDGLAVKAVVDTGSSRTIQNTAAGRPIDPSVATSLDEMRVRGAASDSTLTTLSTPLQVILAGRLITAVVIPRGTLHVFKVWALEDTPAVLLGMDVLGACRRLIIDYPRSELLLPD